MRGADEIHLSPQALVGLLLALASSNVLPMLYANYKTEPEAVRPDPYTGTMAHDDFARVQREIDGLSRRIDAIRADVNLCLSHVVTPK